MTGLVSEWTMIERTADQKDEQELRDVFWMLGAREIKAIYGTHDGPVIIQAIIRLDGRFKP